MCVFCHLPHNSVISVPLWSHQVPEGPFVTYSSSTLSNLPETPGATSRLCLGCHDGTVALGNIVGERISLQGVDAVGAIPLGASNLSSDLSDDHPVSIVLDPTIPELIWPVPPARVDNEGKVQCSSCHDAHNNQYDNFLLSPDPEALCLCCHQKNNWPNATHGPTGAAGNGCHDCHAEHTANIPERLLNDDEEYLCFGCHEGTVASDIKADFETKPYVHPVSLIAGVHDPAERPYEIRQTPPWLPEISSTAVRHAECVDFHDPHSASATQPFAGTWGIDNEGNFVDQVTHEYEICFKCHGDSENKPATAQNLVDIFHVSNPSFHPLEVAGNNVNVPSLLFPYNVGSIITCGDCHGSSDVDGPDGPHGSDYWFILKKNYTLLDDVAESYFEYELCYGCHDRGSILNDESFDKHKKHIEGERSPCWTCHSAHGSMTNTHLIEFDPTVVTASSSGRLEFLDEGDETGSCYLTCHGADHNPENY